MKLTNRRIRLVLAVFAFAFLAMFARAAWLQGVHAGSYERLASGQHKATIVEPADRGTIFDRTGVQFAIGRQATTVFADPQLIRDPKSTADVVARALRMDPDQVLAELSDRSHGFVYIKRKADPARAAILKKLGILGLGFTNEEQRVYPLDQVASQVVGYAGTDNHGLAGLELGLDHTLSGKPGSETVIRDPAGQAINVLHSTPAHEGESVTLTLDHTIQAQAEAVLRNTIDQWHAKGASAIVLDPRTGGILAMAVEKGYNANLFPIVPKDRQRNRTVTDTYEPGSTFKLVTVSAVLSEGLVTPSTAFTLPYSIHVADRIIKDAHPRGTERLTVDQILSQSSNVGTITLAEKLGAERLSRWISRFGFGHLTGIDFPGETPGIVPPLDKWSGSTIGTLPIGHGIAITPVQMAAAYGTVANDGVWLQPHLVDRMGSHARRGVVSRRILTSGRLAPGAEDDAGRGHRGHRPGSEGSRVQGRGQDGNRRQAGSAGRLLEYEVRGLVRRDRPRDEPAARDPRHHRRAGGVDLGRCRRGAGVPADRRLRPAVPRDSPGRPCVPSSSVAAQGTLLGSARPQWSSHASQKRCPRARSSGTPPSRSRISRTTREP